MLKYLFLNYITRDNLKLTPQLLLSDRLHNLYRLQQYSSLRMNLWRNISLKFEWRQNGNLPPLKFRSREQFKSTKTGERKNVFSTGLNFSIHIYLLYNALQSANVRNIRGHSQVRDHDYELLCSSTDHTLQVFRTTHT